MENNWPNLLLLMASTACMTVFMVTGEMKIGIIAIYSLIASQVKF